MHKIYVIFVATVGGGGAATFHNSWLFTIYEVAVTHSHGAKSCANDALRMQLSNELKTKGKKEHKPAIG